MKTLKFLILFLLLISCNETGKKEQNSHNVFYDKAFTFLEKNERDSAYYYFDKARIEFSKNKDSLHIAKCYVLMASIQRDYGDYFGSEEQSVNIIKYSNIKNPKYQEILVSSFNNLGMIKFNLRDYSSSISFFKKSINLANGDQSKTSSLNNLAVVYQYDKKYDQALKIYDSLLAKNKIEDVNSLKIKSNIGYVKFLKNPNYEAQEELQSVLKLQIKDGDLWGQNASHAHLSDFYEKRDREKSLFHAYEMYKIASQLKSPDDRLEALQKLVLLENPENSHKYFKIYQKLNDSLQTARAKAKNQFAFIRYETEKNKADLLSAQAENDKKESRLIFTYIFVLLLLATIVAGIFWYKKRKIRLEQEKELEVKNTALNYSKKVHDVVANGLYQTMVEVQNQDAINKEKVLDKLEDLYEKSRDISKEESPTMLDFHQKIFEKLNAYSSSETKVFIVGNNPETWQNTSEEIKKELLNVLQELLVNMKKHSGANLVSIKLEKDGNILKIRYLDNGIGIDFKRITKGSGMQNMENRIEGIGGIINFEKNPAGGLIANISIPTNYV